MTTRTLTIARTARQITMKLTIVGDKVRVDVALIEGTLTRNVSRHTIKDGDSVTFEQNVIDMLDSRKTPPT